MAIYILTGLVILAIALIILMLFRNKPDASSGVHLDNINKNIISLNSVLTSEIGKVREENKEAMLKIFNDVQASIHNSLSGGRKEIKDTLDAVSKTLEDKFEKLQKSSEENLEKIRENVEAKLTKSIERSSEDFQKIAETFTRVNDSVNTVIEVGKDIKGLSDILASPKLRGNFGEFTLQQIISQIIPADKFEMQKNIDKNNIVDAVIYLKEGILCIDSKFPLEDYKRGADEALGPKEREDAMKNFYSQTKKHINSIKSKYIIPEKTLDLAFMFVPAESVYYEIMKSPEVMAAAREARIVPVSPNSFYAYLAVISMGFKGMKIEEEAKKILKTLSTLEGKITDVKVRFSVLGKHIDDAKTAYADTSKKIDAVEATVKQIETGKDEQIKLPE